MEDQNKNNLLFFEADSMKNLFDCLTKWQKENKKRLLSINVQQENNTFCCIALTNPTEVIICNGNGTDQARVSGGILWVTS